MSERWYDATVVLGRLLLGALGLRLSLDDVDRLPRTGPVVVACNHVGFLDFMTLAAAGRERGRNLRFLTRHDVWGTPVAGRAMTGMRHVPVDREAPAAAYLQARRLLRDGEAVVLFPEAGVSRSWTVRAMMPGAVALARETGAPLLPVAQWGTQRIWTAGRRPTPVRGRRVDLRFGEPYAVAPGADLGAATADLGRRLTDLLEELQQRPHHRPAAGEDAWWYPAHLGGTAPTRAAARPQESVPRSAVHPTWGPPD